MKKSKLKGLATGSAIYVVAHGQRQRERGRCFSMSYKGIRNPRIAFEAAVNDYALGKDEHCDIAKTDEGYNVVFRYTRQVGGYHGVITWTGFKSKEDFDNWYTPDLRAKQEVVAEGVSSEVAVDLVRQTPPQCYILAGIEEARDPATGRISLAILEMKMANVAFALLKR